MSSSNEEKKPAPCPGTILDKVRAYLDGHIFTLVKVRFTHWRELIGKILCK